MSLVRGNSYVSAGMTGTETEKFQINRSVFVLDGTAGQGYDAYDSEAFPASEQTRRNGFGVSLGTLVRIGAILLIAVLGITIYNKVRIRQMAYEVSRVENMVQDLADKNRQLEEQVTEARDLTRISYAAVQTLGMIPMEEAEIYYVTAPDTRPFAVKGEAGNENTR